MTLSKEAHRPGACSFQAFIAGESADAVPVDQIIIYPEKQIPVLLLPNGKIHIRVIDKSAHILGQYTVSMK